MPKMPLPIGVGDYKEVIEGQYDHVDKSMFIKAFLDEPAKATLIIRPRRFGKSYNLSLLRYFFTTECADNNRKLFNGTLIEHAESNQKISCMDFQGKYPVIMISLKGVRAQTYQSFLDKMSEKMSSVYGTHAYLLESTSLRDTQKAEILSIIEKNANQTVLELSLQKLTLFLHTHHQKKPMVFMDEYDTPMHSAYLSEPSYHNELRDFMKIFMGEAFKDNDSLEKALITGILRVGLMDLFSGVNSIPTSGMMSKKYSQFFGFTQTETEAIVKRHSRDLNENELSKRLADIKACYNGYKVGDTLVYNPWSIIQCLDHEGELDTYWQASGQDSLVGNALLKARSHVKAKLTELLMGHDIQVPLDENTVLADLERDEGALWHVMLSSGYLKVQGKTTVGSRKLYVVAVPNQELLTSYQKIIEHWFDSIGQDAYFELFESLAIGKLDVFEGILRTYLEESISYHDLGHKTTEKYYHILMLGMFFVLKHLYTIESNKEHGLGRYDIVLIPHDNQQPGYVFEFKSPDDPQDLEKAAQQALEQITIQKYDTRLKQEKIRHITHVGIGFCGKQLCMMHRTQQFD